MVSLLGSCAVNPHEVNDCIIGTLNIGTHRIESAISCCLGPHSR